VGYRSAITAFQVCLIKSPAPWDEVPPALDASKTPHLGPLVAFCLGARNL